MAQLSEIVFPLLGTAFVVLCVLPVFAACARLLAWFVEHDPYASPFERLNLRYLLLLGSSSLPLAWFASAAAHQAESGESVLGCLFEHEAAAQCFEPGLFALTLTGFLIWRSWRVVRRGLAPRAASGLDADEVLERCARLSARDPQLAVLRGRVRVTSLPGFALGTCGWLHPKVHIGLGFAQQLSDELLRSALGHEAEHVRLRDPLRYTLLRFALAANPIGAWLLQPVADRWFIAREAQCDRQAVLNGAAPLALAEAIVCAARPGAAAVALGAHDATVLRLRIGLLIAFSEKRPAPRRRERLGTFPPALALLGAALALPHHASTLPLDVLHTSTEQTLSYILP